MLCTSNFCVQIDKRGDKLARDTATRKWQITINNPMEKGLTHDNLKERINEIPNCEYWCMSDEIGQEGTYHTHLFMKFKNAVMFSTMQKRFEGAHFEMANGTSQQNRDYIRKEGKWEKDKKKETNLPDTFEEYGEMPMERQGFRNDLAEQYDMIKQGMSNYQIMEQFDGNIDISRIERMRLTYLSEQYREKLRDIKVVYIQGPSNCGKTTGVYDRHGFRNVYKVDNWKNPFDTYNCQSILLLDDWRDFNTPITDMLRYLDKFPLVLPARNADKQACYETVYITSNEPLDNVYNHENTKISEQTREAFLRRIHEVWIYNKDYTYKAYSRENYFKRKETEFISIDEYNQAEFPWVVG